MKAIVAACLVLACSANIFTSTPDSPEWPLTWSAWFNETTNYYDNLAYTGGYGFYDYPSGHLNWTRFNGAADILCNSTWDLNGTTCSHLYTNRTAYLHAPSLDSCCMCCTEENGCAMPLPNATANYTFLAKAKYYGQKAFFWREFINDVEVVYVETAQKNPLSRNMLAMLTGYDNYTYVSEFNRSPNDLFELPTTCHKAKACPGLCATIRDQSAMKLRGSRKTLFRTFPYL